MNSQELKQYINGILGNSIRCLLPSYWWKRLFGLILDKIEDKADKSYVDNIINEIINNEEVSAAALADIDERINELVREVKELKKLES
jgi:hypothetical protein